MRGWKRTTLQRMLTKEFATLLLLRRAGMADTERAAESATKIRYLLKRLGR